MQRPIDFKSCTPVPLSPIDTPEEPVVLKNMIERDYFPQFIEALNQTEAGYSLKNTYRWKTQFHKNGETDETWNEVFGATGRVFTHSILFYNITKEFLKREKGRFTPEQEETFLYGIGPHDVGEAKLSGEGGEDVPAITKTEADERKESKIARKVIASLNLPQRMKAKLWHSYDQVVNGKDPVLNRPFKALEKSEYVLTAIKVYKNNRRLEALGKPRLNPDIEQALVGRVLVVDLAKVLDVYIPEFPNSIGYMFRHTIPLIDEMFEFSMPFLKENKFWMEKEINHEELAASFAHKWEAFKAGK